MLKQAIQTLIQKEDLSFEAAHAAMDEIMGGNAVPTQVAAFLTALRMKGETIGEITACATAMREHCTKLMHDGDLLEIVGTGGDLTHSFNISTVSAFVVAAAGVPVAKHGNRSVSSKCGAADLLEALGANIALDADHCQRILAKTGLCFLFAPVYHPAMKHVAPIRRDLGVRTIFNILGPLCNPADAKVQLLGVYEKNLVEPLAQTLLNLGVKRAMVVCGNDGMDEITLCTTTSVCEIKENTLHSYVLDPQKLGFDLCEKDALTGGDAAENAMLARQIFSGDKGPKRDVVLLNAGACLYLYGKADTLQDGIALAQQVLDSGCALATMHAFVQATKQEVES